METPTTPTTPEFKKCARCERMLPASCFAKNVTSPNGLQSWCKECAQEYSHARIVYKDVGVKMCKKCRRFLPKTDFNASSSHSDGLQTYCKECDREHGRLRNGTTGEYKPAPIALALPDITKVATQQLVDELKRRGYTGKLTISSEIEI